MVLSGTGKACHDLVTRLRPPILGLISRTSHEVRDWVLSHAGYPLGEADDAHDCRREYAAGEYYPVER